MSRAALIGFLPLLLPACIVDRLVTPVPPLVLGGRSFYASPTGTPTAAGTLDQPWDLVTALQGADGRVIADDTIWLRGGTYARPEGQYWSGVSGGAGHPVVVRQYPGERAIIDGAGTPSGRSALYVEGAWSVFWGFEITNSDSVRTTASTANDVRATAISNHASHTRFVNLVIHDGGIGFFNDPGQGDVEISGCIIYNNGWQAPDRGHGHGIYLTSNSGPVIARDNVVFNQFGYGIHAYTDSGFRLVNIRLEGNVAFNNGTLANNSAAANILVGGNGPASGDVLVDNATYVDPADTASFNVRLGWNAVRNGSVEVRGNYFVGGGPVLEVGYWNSALVRANRLVGTDSLRPLVRLTDPAPQGQRWSANIFNVTVAAPAWAFLDSIYSLGAWEHATGIQGAGDVLTGAPGSTRVTVRANRYEPHRASVVVYNWSDLGDVSVDLSGVLRPGSAFEIRNVQDLHGAPVLAGTYGGGTVLLPVAGVDPPTPVGIGSRAPATGARFNVYLVTGSP